MRKPLLALLPFLVSASFAAEEKVEFNRDIRPIEDPRRRNLCS